MYIELTAITLYHLLMMSIDPQYSFQPNLSTDNILAYLLHRWGEAIGKQGEALAIRLDISKAFW